MIGSSYYSLQKLRRFLPVYHRYFMHMTSRCLSMQPPQLRDVMSHDTVLQHAATRVVMQPIGCCFCLSVILQALSNDL